MSNAARLLSRHVLALQIAAICAAFGAVALCPPASGKMILVPLWPGAEQGMVARAIESGALLVGTGPFPHSLVVSGDRAALAVRMLRRGVLILAAPPAGCGASGVIDT